MRTLRITGLALLVAFVFAGSGCMSIFFHNDGTESKDTQQDAWHHIAVFDLVELSDPVDLSEKCPSGDWRTVKTERGPLALLVAFFTEPFYGPWTVGVGCQ